VTAKAPSPRDKTQKPGVPAAGWLKDKEAKETAMTVIEFKRKAHGGRKTGGKSDLRVYSCKESGGEDRFSVGLRVGASAMKRMRWLVGDFVTVAFDDSAMQWTITRVSDNAGNKLSRQGRDTGDATVRFRIDKDQLSRVGLVEGSGYDCTLVSSESESAVFKMD
jgi:hypothetical protein